MLNYLKLYNHHIPQRAIGTKTPIQALKEWQDRKPELFVKCVYDHTGLDNRKLGHSGLPAPAASLRYFERPGVANFPLTRRR